jgi:DNA-binding NarL/FixJ family response regulator
MIAVMLVDDQDLVRLGLRALLENEDGFTVAGEAADGLAAVEVAARTRPDVVLMDIRMPGIDGLEAIRTVVDGGALLAPSVTRTLIREFAGQAHRVITPHPNLGHLTDREREVVALAAQGMNNDEIAQALVVSPATARTHVSRAMIKLGARDRAQLVVFAYQSGLA